jgi:Protein of unknown function (DUF2510)
MSSQEPPNYGNPPAGPPAGWYPDPNGLQVQRWWDGRQWGPQAQPMPAGPPGAPQGTQAGPRPAAHAAGGAPQTGAPPSARKHGKAVRVILRLAAAGVIVLVIALVLSHIGSGGGSSSSCTSNSCIATEAQQSLIGAVAKDESVITKAACQASTVTDNSGGTYTVGCTVTYSDGSQWAGDATLIPAQDKVAWEPTAPA